MITYSTTNKVFSGVAAISVICLFGSWLVKDIDQLRIPLVLITAAGLLFMFCYAVFFPAYFGCFIRVKETDAGFDFEYLDKHNEVQRIEEINLEELVSFSCFDHSSQVLTKTKLIFRSAGAITKLVLLHRQRVKGVELQTAEIVDRIQKKIDVFNRQEHHPFIERTPSFLSSRAGLYTIMTLVAVLGLAVAFSPAKTEKVVLSFFSLVAMISVLLVRRWNELKQIAKSNKRPFNIVEPVLEQKG